MFCANENTTWNNHWVLYRVFPFHWRLGAKKSAQRSALIFDIFALNNWSCTFKYSDNTYCSSNFMVTRSSGVHGGQDLFVTHGNNYYFHCDRPIALQLLKAYFNGAISVRSQFRKRFKTCKWISTTKCLPEGTLPLKSDGQVCACKNANIFILLISLSSKYSSWVTNNSCPLCTHVCIVS